MSLSISVITPCLNRAQYLPRAIDSVQSQDYPKFNHILVDGGSTDGTQEVITHYKHITWSSEPDRGVYDALNKGVDQARGDIIGFLNSDDYYEIGVFQAINDEFLNRQDAKAVLGGVRVFRHGENSSEEETIRTYSPFSCEEFLYEASWGVPLFNAWFFRREVFEEYGRFDLRYKFVSDRDFLIRLALSGIQYTTLNQVVMNYRHHRGSLTFNDTYRTGKAMMSELRRLALDRAYSASDPLDREFFLRWHLQLSIDQSLMSLQAIDFRTLVECALQGARNDRSWFGKFSRAVVRGVNKSVRMRLQPKAEKEKSDVL